VLINPGGAATPSEALQQMLSPEARAGVPLAMRAVTSHERFLAPVTAPARMRVSTHVSRCTCNSPIPILADACAARLGIAERPRLQRHDQLAPLILVRPLRGQALHADDDLGELVVIECPDQDHPGVSPQGFRPLAGERSEVAAVTRDQHALLAHGKLEHDRIGQTLQARVLRRGRPKSRSQGGRGCRDAGELSSEASLI